MDHAEMLARELKGYFDPDGRLKQMPTKRRKKILALVWLAEHIPARETYGERAFSELLNSLHSFGDPATLRRELFDYWLINRDNDGRNYCVNAERPSLEALLESYC